MQLKSYMRLLKRCTKSMSIFIMYHPMLDSVRYTIKKFLAEIFLDPLAIACRKQTGGMTRFESKCLTNHKIKYMGFVHNNMLVGTITIQETMEIFKTADANNSQEALRQRCILHPFNLCTCSSLQLTVCTDSQPPIQYK